MKKTLSILLLLACAASAAHAQSAVTATFSDIILGFSATNSANGAGSDKNLEINLGNVGHYYNLPANTTLNLGNLRADLESVYDLVWNSRDDLTWELVGTTGSATGTTLNTATGSVSIAAKTVWGGKAETTAGVQTTSYNRATTFTQQNAANTIATLYTGAVGSFVPLTGTRSSTVNDSRATVIDNTLAGSWSNKEGTNSSAFGFFSKTLFEASTNFTTIAGSFAVIDLFELQPGSGAGVYRGSFALNSDGLLQFSNNAATFALSAVPEPSAYAVLLGARALGGAALRRRKVVPAAASTV